MLFSSQAFILGFLPPVLALYWAVAAHRRARQAVVVGASLLFYALWNWRFVPVLLGLALLTWGCARLHARTGRQAWLWAGVALNLGALGWFKYANFLAGSVAWLAGAAHAPWAIALPLGISFFAFQKVSYLLDLAWARRRPRPIYGLLDFAEFVSFFPQLIAGPLVRHDEIIGQMERSPRAPGAWEGVARGAVLFVIGLAKKATLADTLALVCDPLYARAAAGVPLSAAEAWAAAGTYMLQIYFDFSGYSDMAIGLGLMLGLRLPFNFDRPYRACSVREFWRRWHMTLSRFLRDYLYIPLGGNRVAPWRQGANVVATMLLGGLWHGAAWTFVAWGGLHGGALALNSAWDRTGLRMPRPLGWALTLLFVLCGWVLFRAPDFATAGSVLAGLAGAHGLGRVHVDNAAVVAIAVVVALLGPSSQAAALSWLRPSAWMAVPAGLALVALLLLLGGRVPNEFIYFRF